MLFSAKELVFKFAKGGTLKRKGLVWERKHRKPTTKRLERAPREYYVRVRTVPWFAVLHAIGVTPRIEDYRG